MGTKASKRVEVSSTVVPKPKSPTPISTKLKTSGKISLLNRRPSTTKSFAGKNGIKKPFSKNKGFNKFSFKRFKRESAADNITPEVRSSKSENLDKLHLSSKNKPFKVAKHLK